ncbi:glutathione synthase/RimK-type ligase-like ATP-grasp enzyme [Bacillus tianshenii]|uniref:Glutathione synthase/RimK-type ligase-like ATP-grasp enzyme n=1 Tax=Sutcliffiella tianshenii TaxID=1463404 RepID=A0ABS2P1F5_9BACI|nr:YheC/YheD family protein [Bacillus tianshenii]MBM7620789.1 glutathione synthase/RimK-type ligase-like ATP-grasp enzyme [Bacillus tianshenii]
MNFHIVRVVPFESVHSVPIIQVSEALVKKLKLPQDISFLDLQCSRNTISAPVVSIKGEECTMRLDPSILHSLLLFEEEKNYLVTYDQAKQKLVIGPVIGLLTEISLKEEQIDLKSIHAYCQELANFSDEIGAVFYVFSVPDKRTDKSIEGYYYENDAWKRYTLPFPQVIHNRLHKRTNERQQMFQDFTQALQEWKIPYFNDHFLDKWTVYKQLQEAGHLRPFLPDTTLFSKESLEGWLDLYSTIFIKPINGSQGKQIFKVCKEGDCFHLSYSSIQQEVSSTYSTFAELYKRLSSHIRKKKYIIQEGIDLLDLDGRPVDFRYLCHRGENHRWRMTSSTARASKTGYFVSNLAQGGEMLSVTKALRSRFEKEELMHLRQHLKEIALEVANVVGTESDGIYGELGIDLAVDRSGRPWIIEVNTKPSKNMDSTPSSSMIRPSAKAIILYCLFLIDETIKEA